VSNKSEQERKGQDDEAATEAATIGALRRALQDLRNNPTVARLIDRGQRDQQIPSVADIERMARRVHAMRTPRTPR
jgi:hypothetical protein